MTSSDQIDVCFVYRESSACCCMCLFLLLLYRTRPWHEWVLRSHDIAASGGTILKPCQSLNLLHALSPKAKRHELLHEYPVLKEREGQFVAQFKFTVLLLPGPH
eukprot:1938026-Amphidinium_carterae.1